MQNAVHSFTLGGAEFEFLTGQLFPAINLHLPGFYLKRQQFGAGGLLYFLSGALLPPATIHKKKGIVCQEVKREFQTIKKSIKHL